MSWDGTIKRETQYSYSEPIIIKRWPGGQISVVVGYVNKHPEKNCIRLEKRWTATKNNIKTEKFNIKNSEDWLKIRAATEKLWPELSEIPSALTIQKAISKASQDMDLLELVTKYPSLLEQIPEDINILALPDDHKESLKKFLKIGGEVANSVIRKLGEQPVKDIKDFVTLLEGLKLSTINSLVTHVTSRINFIDQFEKVIHDDKSYERRGPGSVHNLLKANMWIIDRNYSILHDDETLKNIIIEQWGKEIKPIDEPNTRPDFLCLYDPLAEVQGRKNLVILEIKRPSIKIKFDHMGQVMNYRSVLQKYSGKTIDKFTCYMIGREIDNSFAVTDYSDSGFIRKTYTDFISEARNFYKEYLKIIESEQYAV